VKRLYFRGDAAFANPEIYEFLKAEGIEYAIRLPANRVLEDKIGSLLKRPADNRRKRYAAPPPASAIRRRVGLSRAVSCRPPSANVVRNLPLPKTPEGTIMAPQTPGIRGMSVYCGRSGRDPTTAEAAG
jgi:hypothetical protein